MPDVVPSFKGYRIYPRGFLGASLGEQIKPTERSAASQLRTYTYHPEWFSGSKAKKEINRNVENLWRRLNDGAGVLDDEDYREQLLRVALNAFGTVDFLEWLLIQQSGPSTGDLHMEFLKDTLQFIETGKRGLGLHAWTSMLTMSDITHNQTKDDGAFSWFFLTPEGKQKNILVLDVVQRWCSQRNGFADLAQTLHVLFGEV